MRFVKKLLGILFAWIKDGLSLDETKVSLMMFSFFVFLGVSVLYLVRWHTDIPDNLYNLMNLLIIVLGVVTTAKEIGGSDGILDKAISIVKSKFGGSSSEI